MAWLCYPFVDRKKLNYDAVIAEYARKFVSVLTSDYMSESI